MNSQKIKLFTDSTIIPAGMVHTFLLIPFLGNYAESLDDPDKGRFDELQKKGTDFYVLTENPEEAHFFLLPFGYSFENKHVETIETFLKKARQFSKTTLIFFNSDDDRPIEHTHVLVFRTSLNKSTKKVYEFALPGWSLDFKNYFKEQTVSALTPTSKPNVSYCGYVDYERENVITYLKNIFFKSKADNESLAKSIRGKACRIFKKNKSIHASFIIRNGFWAPGIDNKHQARLEYAHNMINSLYAIATRGGGNFSYRFYEIVSCGRIPVFINTNSVLPFEEDVNYNNHVVWIEKADLDSIDKSLIAFHQNKSPDQLVALQHANRTLYEQRLSPMGFFMSLHNQLKKLT